MGTRSEADSLPATVDSGTKPPRLQLPGSCDPPPSNARKQLVWIVRGFAVPALRLPSRPLRLPIKHDMLTMVAW
jgi:hypothetical protein